MIFANPAFHLEMQNKDSEPAGCVNAVLKQSNDPAGNQQDLTYISCLFTVVQRTVWQCVSVFETQGASELKAEDVRTSWKMMTGGGRKAGIKFVLKKKQMLGEKQIHRAWSQSWILHMFIRLDVAAVRTKLWTKTPASQQTKKHTEATLKVDKTSESSFHSDVN